MNNILIPNGSIKDQALRNSIDWAVLKDYEHFVKMVNRRTLFQKGIVESYNPTDPALGLEVEYFHPSITADDRMVYIMENIVTVPGLKWQNVIGNTIISHFYGARGVHNVLTGIDDDKKAHIDFVLLGKEQQQFKETGDVGEYTKKLRKIAVAAKENKQKIWGTTELHTSIQTAGRRFVNEWYLGNARHDDKGTWSNVSEWIASWTHRPSGYNPKKTVMTGMREAKNLYEGFLYLTGENMIGDYYGYHCSTSNSVNPKLNFSHDSKFVAPGPGACETLELMFPGLSKKEVPLGERVVWIRENQKEILDIEFHKELWNYTTSNGIKIFEDEQNELKSYGTEVSLCQYSVYCRLKSNPHLIKKRKVARVAPKAQPQLLFEKTEMEEVLVGETCKVKMIKEEPSDQVKQIKKAKTKKITLNQPQIDLIKRIMESLGGTSIRHDQVLKVIISEGGHGLRLDSNWKESWAIMQEMVKANMLIKTGQYYDTI
mgnify:CR=1 FL=1